MTEDELDAFLPSDAGGLALKPFTGVQIMPRPTILTPAVLARVVFLVDHGYSAAQIAREIGCTVGTLRVRCSFHGISLRRRATGRRGGAVAATEPVPSAEASAGARCESFERVNTVEQSRTVATSSPDVRIEFKVLLPKIAVEQTPTARRIARDFRLNSGLRTARDDR
jgi:hypothetical protein